VESLPSDEDLKDLYNKVMPPMNLFEKLMYEFSAEHKNFKKAIEN
jgi:hypothetical protein